MQEVAYRGGEMNNDRIAEEIAKLREEINRTKKHAIIAIHYILKHI
jgi:hypothetical protein